MAQESCLYALLLCLALQLTFNNCRIVEFQDGLVHQILLYDPWLFFLKRKM